MKKKDINPNEQHQDYPDKNKVNSHIIEQTRNKVIRDYSPTRVWPSDSENHSKKGHKI